MKNKITGVMAIAMLLLVGLIAPASAGDHQVRICHATASESNPYTSQPIPKHEIADEDGHGSFTAGVHPDDIIPPFGAGSQGNNSWDDYPGKNWDAEGQAVWSENCNDGDNDNGDNGPGPVSNFIETSHVLGACGSIEITLRNVSPWIYPVSYSTDGTEPNANGPNYGPVVDNRGESPDDQTATKTLTFAEDEGGGSVTVKYVVAAGTESDLYNGLPVGDVVTVVVNTDCKTPKPDPKPDPKPEPEPEPVADINVTSNAVCATEDTYDLDLTFSNDGDADGIVTVNILEASTDVFVEAGDSVTETFPGIPAGTLAEVFFDEDNVVFVSDDDVNYEGCIVVDCEDEERSARGDCPGDPSSEPPTEEPKEEPREEPKEEEPKERETVTTPVERTTTEVVVPTRVDAGSGGTLPNTGMPAFVLALMGLGLMLSGGGALSLARKRK